MANKDEREIKAPAILRTDAENRKAASQEYVQGELAAKKKKRLDDGHDDGHRPQVSPHSDTVEKAEALVEQLEATRFGSDVFEHAETMLRRLDLARVSHEFEGHEELMQAAAERLVEGGRNPEGLSDHKLAAAMTKAVDEVAAQTKREAREAGGGMDGRGGSKRSTLRKPVRGGEEE